VEEIEEARRIYRRQGYPVVDMSNRQIEEAADEVVNLTRAAQATRAT
jgi:regulator of PEP synthase PpsR (kinase-PPPase family)